MARARKRGDDATNARKRYYRSANRNLKKADKLSPATRAMYDKVNAIVPAFVDDTPFYDEIAKVEEMLRS